MALNAGELKERIIIKKPERTPNGSGGVTTSYVDVINTYAKVVEKSSNPNLVSSQENIFNYVEFTIRFRPVLYLKNGYRIVWRGFNFNVNNIKVDPKRTMIVINAIEEMETSKRETTT